MGSSMSVSFQSNSHPKKLNLSDREYIFYPYENNPRRRGLFIRRIKQGPPSKHRWEAWQMLLNIRRKEDSSWYVDIPLGTSKSLSSIRKDISRTFPEKTYFQREGKEALERVLGKLSGKFPSVGYCQSMNYIVGFLLLVSKGKEAEVFNLMEVLLVDFNFQGFFKEDMSYLKQCLWVFRQLLKEKFPKIHSHLRFLGIIEDNWILKWLITCFTVSFNFKTARRFWDILLVHKNKALFELSLAVVGVYQEELIRMDTHRVCSFFDSELKNIGNPEEIIQYALRHKIPFSDIKCLETMYILNHSHKIDRIFTCTSIADDNLHEFHQVDYDNK